MTIRSKKILAAAVVLGIIFGACFLGRYRRWRIPAADATFRALRD